MRFKTRVDRWMAVMLVVAATTTCVGLPLLTYTQRGFAPDLMWLPLLATACSSGRAGAEF